MRGALFVCAALPLFGCSSPAEDVTAAWKKAGHTPGSFSARTQSVPDGAKCQAGTVGGFAATLCEFDSAEAALAAEEKGFDLIEGGVGTSVAAGKMLLVVSDPKKEDPSGRRMNEVIKVYREQAK